MSSNTDRHCVQHDGLHTFFNQLLWRLIDWRPDVFELYASIIWILWGGWLLVDPHSAPPDRYSALFKLLRPEALGAALMVIGAGRFCGILASSFAIRRITAFVVTIGWGGIALLLLWSRVNILAVSHAIFAIVSGWGYLRMRE